MADSNAEHIPNIINDDCNDDNNDNNDNDTFSSKL